MSVFENRTGAYVWVREDRKRRKLAFAGQHQLNVDWSQAKTRNKPLTVACHDFPMASISSISQMSRYEQLKYYREKRKAAYSATQSLTSQANGLVSVKLSES